MQTIVTKDGVFYDVKKSPFIYEFFIDNESVKLHFSSEFKHRTFCDKLPKRIIATNLSLLKRFGVTVDCTLLETLRFYKQHEVRGYAVFYRGEWLTCAEVISLTLTKSKKKD